MHPDQNKKKGNAWTLAGMAVGIAAMVIGLVFLFGFKDETFYGSTVRLGTAVYGADFYTDIYKSTTFAANALKDIYEMLSTCFGVLFLLLGHRPVRLRQPAPAEAKGGRRPGGGSRPRPDGPGLPRALRPGAPGGGGRPAPVIPPRGAPAARRGRPSGIGWGRVGPWYAR